MTFSPHNPPKEHPVSNVVTLANGTKAHSASTSAVVSERPVPEVAVDPLLTTILSWRRKHASPSEGAFGGWLLTKLKKTVELLNTAKAYPRSSVQPPASLTDSDPQAAVVGTTVMDQVVAIVPQADGSYPTVLFSCHVDTQDHGHGASGPCNVDGLKQQIEYDPNFGHIFLAKGSTGGCLGADDGIGVWIMLRMIEQGVPGAYVFHRGEEVGGLGSAELARCSSDWLKRFKQAVAFDRPNHDEVIVQQGGQTCASNAYGEALAKAINGDDPYFAFKTSTRGIFTDTKNYRKCIAECVNIGVGYWGHHGTSETQDYAHAHALMERCLTLDWHSLPVSRDPSVADTYTGGYYGSSYRGRGTSTGQRSFAGYDFDDSDHVWRGHGASTSRHHYGGAEFGGRTAGTKSEGKGKRVVKAQAKGETRPVEMSVYDELSVLSRSEMEAFVFQNPKAAASCMIDLISEVECLTTRVARLRKMLGLGE